MVIGHLSFKKRFTITNTLPMQLFLQAFQVHIFKHTLVVYLYYLCDLINKRRNSMYVLTISIYVIEKPEIL